MGKKQEDPYDKFRNHPEAILNRTFCDENGNLRDQWKGPDGKMSASAQKFLESEKAEMPERIKRWSDWRAQQERHG
jgi:hypothetical protein